MTRPLTPRFSAVWRPTNARWLNDLSFRPPMSVTRQALKAALCAADAELPRMAANRDARSTVATASAASVSQRFLTWMNPPMCLTGGTCAPSLARLTDRGYSRFGSVESRCVHGPLEVVLGDKYAAGFRAL